MKNTAITFLFAGAVAMATLLPDAAEAGRTKKWRANNHSGSTVKVFWQAAGCAGSFDACRWNKRVQLVCKTKILHPGESSYYKFDDGTSDRRKKVCRLMKDGGDRLDQQINSTGKRKKNGIRINNLGEAEWFYD